MIDLHLHTNHSDGTDTIIELLQKAEKEKLEVISITDHDTVSGYKELENINIKKIFSGKIITGTEIKAIYNNKNVEVLGYGIDYRKIKIKKCDNLQEKILEHLKNIADKYNIQYDKNIAIDKSNSNIFGSYVFANEILKYKENIIKLENLGEKKLTNNNFFRKCESNPNSIFYFDALKYVSTLEEVIKEIHNAGGLAFLAHAYIYNFENPKNEIENIIKTTDIDGLECQYPLFTEDQRQEIMSLCKKYNKYMSGGSDYHADRKPNVKIGTGIDNNLNIQKEFIQNWIQKVLIIN